MANNWHVLGGAANQIIKISKFPIAERAFPNGGQCQAAGLMIDRSEEFLSQAKIARERAAAADGDFRRQWLKVAEMWEMLATEYRRFHHETSAEHQRLDA